MNYFIGILGIIVILLLAILASNNRKAIRFKPIFTLLVLQFLLTFLLINTQAGQFIISGISTGFNKLLSYASEGVNFVFGGLVNAGEFSFLISVLLPIVFISALIGILYYCKILTIVIKAIGFLLSKVNGMGKLESYNAVAALFLGQQEVFISVKHQLGLLPEKRLYTLCTSAMSTVSMAIVGSYMAMIEPKYVVLAIILNLFGGFIIASLICPYRVDPAEDILAPKHEEKTSFFEVLGEYILDGFKVAIIVGAMLIGFIALIAMVNNIFDAIFGITFQAILGYILSPVAFLIGIPFNESLEAGQLMGIKLVSNEFAAMTEFIKLKSHFSDRSQAIISVFLVSFANFASIGIISGAVKALCPEKGNQIARFGLKLVFGASLVSALSATIVGLLYGISF